MSNCSRSLVVMLFLVLALSLAAGATVDVLPSQGEPEDRFILYEKAQTENWARVQIIN